MISLLPISGGVLFVIGIVMCVVAHITYNDRLGDRGLIVMLIGYLVCTFGIPYYLHVTGQG